MKKIFSFLSLITISFCATAQSGAELYEVGKKFLVQGDMDNAVLVLKKAVQAEPTNGIYLQDLASAYLYREEYKQAQIIVDELVKLPSAQPYAFYLAYNISMAQNDLKTAEKHIKKGLDVYDNSGLLYHAYGDILTAKGDASGALAQFELGIKREPSYAGNYYDASKIYYYLNDLNAKIWAIHYGEMFINMESATTRSLEMKEVLVNSYKILAAEEKFGKKGSKNDFEEMYMQQFLAAKKFLATGVTTENLMTFRAIFLHNWFASSTTISNSLYDRMQQLLKEGHFEEYNYWLFEPIQNLSAYDNWMKINQDKFTSFMSYHNNKVFKPKQSDYQK